MTINMRNIHTIIMECNRIFKRIYVVKIKRLNSDYITVILYVLKQIKITCR